MITGSPASVHDDRPWIGHLLQQLREQHARRMPMLGLCFGHQALAMPTCMPNADVRPATTVSRSTQRRQGKVTGRPPARQAGQAVEREAMQPSSPLADAALQPQRVTRP